MRPSQRSAGLTENGVPPWRRWASITCLVLATPLLLLGAAILLVTLDYPHFVFTFILGDPRGPATLLLCAAAGLSTGAWLLAASPLPWRRLRHIAIALAGLALVVLAVGTLHDQLRYGTERASYQSDAGTGAVTLIATVYRPRGAGPFPVVSIVQGSEKTPRDRYHAFAERFVQEGYLVILADRRGVGESGGVFQHQVSPGMLNTLAVDVASGIRYAATRADVDTMRIGVFGVSQAGWVIPLVAPRAPRLAFAVIMSGPAVSTDEEEAFSRLSGEDKDHFGWKPPPIPFDSINAVVAATRSGGGYVPETSLAAMTVPTLWVFGEWDNSIPVKKSVEALEALAKAGNRFTIRVFPGGQHGLFVMRGPQKRLLPYYPPDLWPGVFSWLQARR